MTIEELINGVDTVRGVLNNLMGSVQTFASEQSTPEQIAPPALQGCQDKLREAAYACELARNRLLAYQRDITPPAPAF